MLAKPFKKTKTQNGLATLVFAIFIVIGIALITLLGTRSSIYDIKIQTNEYQHALAFEAAQFGIEQGIAYLTQNIDMINNSTDTEGWMTGTPKWTPCSGTDATIPCGNGQTALYGTETLAYKNVSNMINTGTTGTSFSLHYLTKNESGKPTDYPLVTVITQGTTDSARAQSAIQQTVRSKTLFARVPASPLSTTGNVVATGNLNIWGNFANPSITSIWSKQAVMPLVGSANTYDVSVPTGQYPDNTTILSHDVVNAGDIIENDPDFPPDVFYYLFGIPNTQSHKIKAIAQVYDDCDSLDDNTSGLIWINGDCRLNNAGGPQIASLSAPAMIIVTGELRMTGNLEIWGGIFLRDTSPGVQATGTITMHGFIAIDRDLDLGSGNVNIVYDPNVIHNLNNKSETFIYIPGSWSDTI